MNFLAHLFLSGENEEIITGNFIADHVKGNEIQKFSDPIKNGIYLHRKIDNFTDTHPLFLQSKTRLTDKYRKYSGVIVDMFYDHFLSANWNDYSAEPLEDYTSRMFAVIVKQYALLPEKTKRIIHFMSKENWLAGYGRIDGLARALSGMARRTPFDSGMENAVVDLQRDYGLYEQEFRGFFPQVSSFSKEELGKLGL